MFPYGVDSECDFMPVRRTMSGKNPVSLVTFESSQTKCLVGVLGKAAHCFGTIQVFL